VRFGIRLPGNFLYAALASPWEAGITGAQSLRFARRADELGFDWLWVSEHLVQIPKLVPSMGARFYEGLTAAAVVAGATARIRLLTYVVPLPYHHPVTYAKAAATLDRLSDGRLDLGVSVGYLRKEFDVLGVPFAKRGAVMDESLRAMKALWTEDAPSFHGEHFAFDGVLFEPKPVQRPHPPLFIGGDAPAVLRRAARLGDGWMPWLTTIDELPARVEQLRARPEMAARTRPFEVLALLAEVCPEDRLDLHRMRVPREPREAIDLAGRLVRAGATGCVAHLPRTSCLEECIEWMERFADEVLPAFRG
jgi:probable F420-dependent oxidoreductase